MSEHSKFYEMIHTAALFVSLGNKCGIATTEPYRIKRHFLSEARRQDLTDYRLHWIEGQDIVFIEPIFED